MEFILGLIVGWLVMSSYKKKRERELELLKIELRQIKMYLMEIAMNIKR